VKIKIILDSVNILIPVDSISNILSPPIFLPTVSKTENTELMNTMNQLCDVFKIGIFCNIVSNATAGNTTNVTKNTNSRAYKSPYVFEKFLLTTNK